VPGNLGTDTVDIVVWGLIRQTGNTEAVIDDNCGITKFYAIADTLSQHLQIKFLNQVDDAENLDWDFRFRNQLLTLHFSTFSGVSIFPHHENEIAQSRCAHGTPTMANYWMHNGFLQVEGNKMSKSLGNFITIRDVLKDWPGEVVRLNMLKTHYRSPIDWTLASLDESKKVLTSWYDIVGDDTHALGEVDETFSSLLSDDLNTPGAITRLHAIASSRIGTSGQAQIDVKSKLKTSAMLLGLLVRTKKEYLTSDPKIVLVNKDVVDAFIAQRTAARARKDFKESDRIRDELAAMGVVIKDSKEGTTWEIAR